MRRQVQGYSDPGFDAVIGFPAMRVAVRTHGATVSAIVYLPPEAAVMAPRNRLAERAARQIERYRIDPDAAFDLPLERCGTPFQRAVWHALERIPRGQTRSYGALARSLGTAARAVGQACGENRFPVVIPCHRVVAASGIGGFAHARGGYLLEAKRWLLVHERAL
jgi:methylated-DNA-[protein]-cysteine S-methyltransferase